ncbi:MAG: hypothetical protein ABFS21_11320, partial [Actinomycetota bacterium]
MIRRRAGQLAFAIIRLSLVVGLVASTFVIAVPVDAGGDDLTMTVVDSPDPIQPGDMLTFTVTVSNNSAQNQRPVSIWVRADTTHLSTLSSPDGYMCSYRTHVDVDGDGTPDPAFRCRVRPGGSPLAVGESATITFNATVAADTPTGTVIESIFNPRGWDHPRGGDSLSFGADQVIETTVYAPNDMAITKELVSGGSITPGEPATYELTVSNEGAFPALTPVVTDTLPAGFTATSATSTLGTCSGTTTITCNLPMMAPAESATITIVADTDPSIPEGPVANTATVSAVDDENPANDTATDESIARPTANLTLTITDDPDPVYDGETVTYSAVVGNAGPSDASDVTLQATIPAGTSIVTVTSPGVCSSAAGVVTCTFASIPAAGSATTDIEIAVPVGTTPGTDVLTLTAETWSDVTGTDPDNAESTSVMEAEVDLSVTKTADPVSALAGQDQVTYTLVVDNAGPAAAQNVVVTDTLPTGLTFVSGTWPGGTCGSSISCALGVLPASDSVTVTIIADVDAAATPGTATNAASVSTSTDDADPSNNSTTVDVTITTQADLSITKTASPDPAFAGQEVTYTLTVDNAGPSDAQSVVATDILPAGVTFASSSDCSEAAGVITCDLEAIPAGSSAVATVFATTDAGTAHGTVVTNAATVGSATSDPNLGNNSTSADVTVDAPNDMGIVKEKVPGPQGVEIAPGEAVVYTLTATNHGAYTAPTPMVTDTLPPGLTATGVEWQIDGGAVSTAGCTVGTPVVTCTLPDIGPGSVAAISVYADAAPDLVEGTDLVNLAVVAADGDSNPENDTAQVVSTVRPAADLEVSITDDPDPVNAGESVTYTVVVRNAGPSDVGGRYPLNVEIGIPPATSLVGTPPAPCVDNGPGHYT